MARAGAQTINSSASLPPPIDCRTKPGNSNGVGTIHAGWWCAVAANQQQYISQQHNKTFYTCNTPPAGLDATDLFLSIEKRKYYFGSK
jgi:hypothetical protein